MKPYRLVDTAGQITAVITNPIKSGKLPKLANLIMRQDRRVEQVGYLKNDSFQMMGGELSINGLIAAAYLLNKSGQINGLKFESNNSTISLTFPRSLVTAVNKKTNTVTLKGIKYQIMGGIPQSQNISDNMQLVLKQLAIDSPAAGLVYYQNNQIQPLVYVPATNSYIWENACGSGSLAFSLLASVRQVLQPSSQIISFKINSNNIVVTTSAKEV